jgi:hypothetical protein
MHENDYLMENDEEALRLEVKTTGSVANASAVGGHCLPACESRISAAARA